MSLLSVLSFAHQLLRARLQAGDAALDGTAGNGHDTLLLAQCVGSGGKVWAFDIQQQALDNTAQRLQQASAHEPVQLCLAGHETLAQYVDRPLAAAIFNFGYLPGGDKKVTTQGANSVAALQAAAECLAEEGLLLAVIYSGHAAGAAEAALIDDWAAALPQTRFQVLRYGFINQRNAPPYLLAVEKREQKPCA